MTGKEIVDLFWCRHLRSDEESIHSLELLEQDIISALAAATTSERERCVKVVRNNAGKCVSGASCEALVEEIRTP